MKTIFNYDDLLGIFEKSIRRAEAFKAIPDDVLLLKPDPSSWSAGEIFEHIVRFNNIYLGFIHSAAETPSLQTNGRPDFEPRFVFKYLIKTFRPPYKMKMKTIAPMYPVDQDGDDYREYLNELIGTNREVIRLVREFEQKRVDLRKSRGKNSVFKINMTLIEFLLILDAHQQRHYWQAENTLKKLTGKTYQ